MDVTAGRLFHSGSLESNKIKLVVKKNLLIWS